MPNGRKISLNLMAAKGHSGLGDLSKADDNCDAPLENSWLFEPTFLRHFISLTAFLV